MSEITQEEFETTYKVLEELRERHTGDQETICNEAHYLVQTAQEITNE